MIEIAVNVAGDYWLNAGEVESRLQQVPQDQPVVIDMGSEGASMRALGIDRMIDRYLPADRVTVRAWANPVETVAYHRAERHFYSHFFWMAQRYWHHEPETDLHEHRFACFVGRPTWPRLRMLADLRALEIDCLCSFMGHEHEVQDHPHDLDRRQDWAVDGRDLQTLARSIPSIDGHLVRDQYDPDHNTNLSLLRHYHRFDIEIVSETYCHGEAFLPTEKTIRPLLYRRPIMVYGPRHFLRRLREQGFKTWSGWWDESYDDLEGLERWQAMSQQIQILDRCDHFNVIHDDYQPVLDHNQARAREIGRRHRAS